MDAETPHTDYRTRRLINGILVVVGLAVVATIVVAMLSGRPKGITFTIVFNDARGLALGAPVRLRGLRVGEVTRVELMKGGKEVEVNVAIDRRYADEIPAPPDVSARIKRSVLLPGNQYIIILVREGAKGKMPDGAKIDGVEGLAGEMRFIAAGKVREAAKAAAEKTSQKIDDVKKWWAERKDRKKAETESHDEVQDIIYRLENLDEDNPSKELEALRKRTQELADKWKKEGRGEEAKQIEAIADTIGSYEETLKNRK